MNLESLIPNADYTPTESEIVAAFEQFASYNGFRLMGNAQVQGAKYTWRAQFGKDKGKQTSVTARLYADMPANGWLHSWRTNEHVEWSYLSTLDTTSPQYAAYSAQMPSREEQERKRAQREEAERNERAENERKAREFYEVTAQPFNGTHEYLARKGVRAHEGIKRDASGDLIIPMFSPDDFKRVVSYQRIHADGTKLFAKGARTAGAVYIIGTPQPDKPLGLAEGYATAATVYEATGLPMVVCFNCHNLAQAAAAVKEHIKAADYLIFADNDRANAENPELRKNHGLEAARAAATALKVDSAHVVAPQAAEGCNVDWNDRAAQLETVEELKQELGEKIRYAGLNEGQRRGVVALNGLQPPTLERLAAIEAHRGKGFDLGWTFYNRNGEKRLVKAQGMTIIAARTGGGKTTTLTNIAARALHVEPDAHVLFLSLEEAEESVYYRILGAYMGQSAAAAPTIDEIHRGIGSRGKTLSADSDKWGGILAAANYMESRLLIADLINTPNLRDADFAVELMHEFFERYRERAIICLDYIQMLQPSGKISNDYRDFKRVMTKVKELIAARVTLFAGAQMNRDVADRKVTAQEEFITAICENIREAADIEQAAELILYARGDNRPEIAEQNGTPYMNFRILKNRRGPSDMSMAMAVNWSKGAYDWLHQHTNTFEHGAPAGAPAVPITW